MLNYLDTQNILFTRAIKITIEQYLFVAQVVLGEDKAVAYGMVFDRENFVKNVATEDEEDYLSSVQRKAEQLIDTQECKQLQELLAESYQQDIQAKASTLKDYKFSGADIQQLLANLLHNRTGEGDNLDEASVKDVISLIKMMYEQGALDSGDSFTKHFITVHDPFNALCTTCNREFDAYPGMDCKCPHCNQVYKWSEQEKRFYPNTIKL